MERIEVEYKGNKYGVWIKDGKILRIRSENNPDKQPSLKEGSKKWCEVVNAVLFGIHK